MSTSHFSFHCMICFEEFDPVIRYPVVLPCGHTYVCNCCADRLDKCMECRSPLVWNVPRPHNTVGNNSGSPPPSSARHTASWRSGTRRWDSGPPSPSQPHVKKRLPLPKNVVLLSLIEATALAAADAAKRGNPHSPGGDSSVRSEGSLLDEDEEEEEKIRAGTSLAMSVCGTYAVAAAEGLELYPSRPGNGQQLVPTADGGTKVVGSSDEDVDTLVRFFHMDHVLDAETASEGNILRTNSKEQPPPRLSYGDRVQIVSIESGWAKLSRGYGFVRAGRNELVKVGGAVDRACKLEATLRSISRRRKELRKEQSAVDNQFIELMNNLQASLMGDEDLTVIAGDTFAVPAVGNLKPEPSSPKREERDSASLGRENPRSTDVDPKKPESPSTPPSQIMHSFACFANDIFSPISGRRQQRPTSPAFLSAFTGSFGGIGEGASPDHGSPTVATARKATAVPTMAAIPPSPRSMTAGARAWRERHGRSPSRGINFRTGMSGHMALLSSHAHSHEFLDPQSGRNARLMSHYTGLSMSKPARRRRYDNTHLHMPSFASSAFDDDNKTL